MATLLVQGVEAGRVQDTSAQLAEAQRYLEQATTIYEKLRSPHWMNFRLLARIANLEGHTEMAQHYRRRERETYAAFAGHRFQIDQLFGSLFPLIAAAQDNLLLRVQIMRQLPRLEEKGWHISKALWRIWAGERDWPALTEELDNKNSLLVLRVLETLAASTNDAASPPEQEQPGTTGE